MPEKSALADQRSATYNAIVATYKIMFRKMTEMLLNEGLTQPQFQALRVVAKYGPTPMKTISEKMSVTAAIVKLMVQDLAEIKRIAAEIHVEAERYLLQLMATTGP